ncbi:MAG: hypothetical protein AAF382_01925 [Pseudomonadota bacterium]
MAHVGILTLHGMGNTEPTYAEDLFEEIEDRLGTTDAAKVRMKAVFYQNILQENQAAYFRSVKRRLRWDDLREFMLYGFSDAASLESKKEGEDSPYFQAQLRILGGFKALYNQLSGEDRRVVIIAQSLGGQVISNYLWDAKPGRTPKHGVFSVPQVFASPEEEAFCRGRTVKRLLTTGCNIPIFCAGIARDRITPIDEVSPGFEWHNFYDRDDVLGWPLKPLSDAYAERVTGDHPINAGVLTGFTPLSHINYWRDRDFLRPLIAHIKRSF